jgi:hypothetical protein
LYSRSCNLWASSWCLQNSAWASQCSLFSRGFTAEILYSCRIYDSYNWNKCSALHAAKPSHILLSQWPTSRGNHGWWPRNPLTGRKCIQIVWDVWQGDHRPTGDLESAGMLGPVQLLKCDFGFLELVSTA